MILGDAVSKLETFAWILNHISKVHNLVSVHPKSIIVSQMSNLAVVFHVVVSVWLKFETHPSSPLNFGTAHNFHVLAICALGKMKYLPFWEQLYAPEMLTKLI